MSDSPAISLTEIRTEVLHEVQDDFKKQINYLLVSRKRWRKYENISETAGHILMLVGTILSFSAGIFDNKILAFLSGAVLCLSAASLKLSSYCHAECIERNTILERHLLRLDIKKIPINTVTDV